MSEYRIRITETSSRLITANADDENDAIDKVQTMYTNEKIILDASDYDDVTFEVE